MAGGRLGEYEGVDEGEIEGLHSLLHTVGFFFYFPHSKVLSVLFMKPANSTRERTRERERQRGRQRGRGRESARACVRAAFGALGICTHRNTVRAQGCSHGEHLSHMRRRMHAKALSVSARGNSGVMRALEPQGFGHSKLKLPAVVLQTFSL